MRIYCLWFVISMCIAGCSSTSADTVDSVTKIMASNAVYDNSRSRLENTNLQAAIDELAPDIGSILVGTWEITTYTYPNDSSAQFLSPATMTINQDGTFNLNGEFFVGPGVMIGPSPSSGNWKTYEKSFFGLKTNGTEIYFVPMLIRKSKLIFKFDSDRVVVFTKVQ